MCKPDWLHDLLLFYRNFLTVDWALKTNHLCITDTSVSSGTSHFKFGSLWCAGGRFVRDIYWIAVFCGLMCFHKLITFSRTAQQKRPAPTQIIQVEGRISRKLNLWSWHQRDSSPVSHNAVWPCWWRKSLMFMPVFLRQQCWCPGHQRTTLSQPSTLRWRKSLMPSCCSVCGNKSDVSNPNTRSLTSPAHTKTNPFQTLLHRNSNNGCPWSHRTWHSSG